MDDLERLLQTYRPVGPQPELRDRVLASASRRPSGGAARRRIREWLPAAAAAAAAVAFYALAANERRDAAVVGAAIEAERDRRLGELALTLGGDEMAREAAERLMDAEEAMARADAEPDRTRAIQ